METHLQRALQTIHGVVFWKISCSIILFLTFTDQMQAQDTENTGSFKKIWTIKTRSREEYHITTDQIWYTIHSNTSQVYLERAKLLHNTSARWQAD